MYGRLTRRTHTTIRESHLQQYDANGARAESWVSSGLASCMVPAERCCTLHDAASLRLADRYPGQGIDGTYVAMVGAMADLIFVAVTIAFFVLAIAYTRACDRL